MRAYPTREAAESSPRHWYMHAVPNNFCRFGVHTNSLTSVHTSCNCTHMGRIDIRIPDEDIEAWKRAAQAEGMSLSEWIRGLCNLEVLTTTKGVMPSANVESVGPVVTGEHRAVEKTSANLSPCSCGHPKHKHGGFKGCCQADMCKCRGYE